MSGSSQLGGMCPGNPSGVSRRRFIHTGAAGALSLAVGGGLLAACGDDDDAGAPGGGERVVFGFSHPEGEIPVVATIKGLVADAGEAEGWKVLLDETEGGDLQDQIATLDSWITQKITAINLLPTDPSAFEATARRATDAGIIWTTYAVKMETAAGGALFPPKLFGEATGAAAVKWINENDPKAEVLMLNWPPDPVGNAGRIKIPERMIRSETEAKIVAIQPASEQTKGLQVGEDVLQAHPNVSVVVGINDDSALGAAEAFRKAGKDPSKVWIIGQDGAKDALTALKKEGSFFKASAAIDNTKLAGAVVGVTKRAIDRGWKPGDKQEWVVLGPTVVTHDDSEVVDKLLATLQ
jgi:ABC-type sugar transport system substrate-binding protein